MPKLFGSYNVTIT